MLRVLQVLVVLAVDPAIAFRGIRNGSLPVQDHHAQLLLRATVALLGSQSKPLERDFLALGNAVAVQVNQPEIELRINLTALGQWFPDCQRRSALAHAQVLRRTHHGFHWF